MNAPRILIVDDHAGFRAALRHMLESEGLSVVGEVAHASEVVTAARELAPDVVLLDVLLPDGNGFDVAEDLAAEGANITVVMTSSRPASSYRVKIDRSAAVAFVFKADLSGARIRSLVSR